MRLKKVSCLSRQAFPLLHMLLLLLHVLNCVLEVSDRLFVLLTHLFDLGELSLKLSHFVPQVEVVADGIAHFLVAQRLFQSELLEQLSGLVLKLAFLEQVLLIVIYFHLVLLKQVLFMIHVINHHLLFLQCR